MPVSKDAFVAMVCRKYFNIPPLKGNSKRFIDCIRAGGAHYVLSAGAIEHRASGPLLRELVLLYWRGYIPSFSVTLHA